MLNAIEGAGKKYRVDAMGQGLLDLLVGKRWRHHESGKSGVFPAFSGSKKKTVFHSGYVEQMPAQVGEGGPLAGYFNHVAVTTYQFETIGGVDSQVVAQFYRLRQMTALYDVPIVLYVQVHTVIELPEVFMDGSASCYRSGFG